MDILDHLAVALGFATLAGINLYLTVFATGLAIRFGWVVLAEQHAELAVLGEWPVLAVAGVLFAMEFFADKVPLVDSVWDGFHSLIRPIGGGLLAVSAMGTTRPEYDVIIALVAGGATLVSHGFKSGTRLMVNTSPEPVSNSIVSVAEDVAVVGGLVLMAVEPKVLGGICIVLLAVALFAFPKVLRRARGFFWLMKHNLRSIGGTPLPAVNLGAEERQALLTVVEAPDLLWSAPVLTSRVRGIPNVRSWLLGQLVAVGGSGEARRLFFVGQRWGKMVCVEIPGGKLHVAREHGILSEKLYIYDEAGTFQAGFRLPRSRDRISEKIMDVVRTVVPRAAESNAP